MTPCPSHASVGNSIAASVTNATPTTSARLAAGTRVLVSARSSNTHDASTPNCTWTAVSASNAPSAIAASHVRRPVVPASMLAMNAAGTSGNTA